MNTLDTYNAEYSSSLIGALGIQLLPAEGTEVRALMPVDQRTAQPFGLLHGGASLALAESLAGHGSRLLCADGEMPCGVQVSGNHLAAACVGETVYATATLLHKGRTTHTWNIDICNEQGTLVSTVRVVNYILRAQHAS